MDESYIPNFLIVSQDNVGIKSFIYVYTYNLML